MTNPYEPPAAIEETEITSLSQRNPDQCPYCLSHQSLWSEINKLGKFRCLECGKELVVVLPGKVRWLVLLVIFAVAACCQFFMLRIEVTIWLPIIGLVLVPLGISMRYFLGHLEPANHYQLRADKEGDEQ